MHIWGITRPRHAWFVLTLRWLFFTWPFCLYAAFPVSSVCYKAFFDAEAGLPVPAAPHPHSFTSAIRMPALTTRARTGPAVPPRLAGAQDKLSIIIFGEMCRLHLHRLCIKLCPIVPTKGRPRIIRLLHCTLLCH